MPQVSVCVPTYNGEKYLAECLDSIAAQEFGDYEVLLVDDSSSDATLDVAAGYAGVLPNFRIIRNDRNLGLVENWNRCIDFARGQWIKFVFQDDLITPECLSKMLSACDDDTMLVACERDFAFDGHVESKLERLYRMHREKLHEFFAEGPRLSAEQLALFALANYGVNPLGEPTSVLVNRRCFERFGMFSGDFVSSCDTEYWYRVGTLTGATVLRETLATFRVHGDATSATNRDKRYYRAFFLDSLLLLDEFVHSPYFDSLRRIAAERQFDLAALYKQKKNQARAVADWSAQANDEVPMHDWCELVRKHGSLAPSFLEHVIWRARNRLSAH